LYVYQTGSPWGVPGGLEYLHNAHVSRTTEKTSGYNTIRGVNGCVADTNADTGAHTAEQNDWTASHTCSQFNFVVRPGYAVTQNVTYSGVRIPSDHQFDTNLSKNFAIPENFKLQFRLEAFNVLNHPLWQEGYDGTANSPTFGTIPKGPWGQSNLPRQVQLALKLMW